MIYYVGSTERENDREEIKELSCIGSTMVGKCIGRWTREDVGKKNVLYRTLSKMDGGRCRKKECTLPLLLQDGQGKM